VDGGSARDLRAAAITANPARQLTGLCATAHRPDARAQVSSRDFLSRKREENERRNSPPPATTRRSSIVLFVTSSATSGAEARTEVEWRLREVALIEEVPRLLGL
jgi:hypothetical protein